MFFVKLNFQDEGQLFVIRLFYILPIYPKSFTFQFLSRGIRIYFPILTGVKNGRITSWKIGEILLKILILILTFQGDDQFYANWFW